MNAQKVEVSEQVQVRDTLELIDCGRASERTKGSSSPESFEFSAPPYHWFSF